MAQDKTNSQIGQELFLAEKTVKNYVSSILSKLEVGRRSEAAAYLARHSATPASEASRPYVVGPTRARTSGGGGA